jgi:2'-5' RNA ligase
VTAPSRKTRWPGTSSIVVPVPVLEGWVRARSQHYDPAYVSTDPSFAHAHLTLLSPFVTAADLTGPVRSRVAEVLAGHGPFTVRLATVDRFPDGIVHLVPEPAAPLRRLTADLAAAFPAYPRYGGRFGDDVRPHLTLDLAGPGVDVDSVRRSLGLLLPASTRVDTAVLSWYEQDRCRILARWTLGRHRRVSNEGP